MRTDALKRPTRSHAARLTQRDLRAVEAVTYGVQKPQAIPASIAFANDPEPLPKFAIAASALLVLCVAALCCLLSACTAYVPTAKPTPADRPQGTPELAQATATLMPE